MTLVSKNMYIDKLDDIVSKYNNIYHSTIEMKPVDVNSNTHIHSSKETNDENPKFKIRDIVRTSKYKKFFCKRPCFKLVWRSLVITKGKNAVLSAYVIRDRKDEEIVRTFYKKRIAKKQIKRSLELKK